MGFDRSSFVKDHTWQERIEEAGTEPEVVAVARDYLAMLTQDEYAGLPLALRPRKIVDGNDMAAYAFELALHQGDDPSEMNLVQRLAQVMSRASVRISEIIAASAARAG
jgi:hypothetical protein